MDFAMASRKEHRRGGRAVPLVLASLVFVAVAAQVLAFVTGIPRTPSTRLRRMAAQAEVSSSASSPAAGAKARLLDLLDDSMLEQEVLRPEGKPIRGRVDEAIVALERLNANEEPVYSMELDGTWTVKYTGSYAPGLLSSPTRELALFLYGGGFSLGNALSSFTQGFWGQSLGVKLGSKQVRIESGRDVEAVAEVDVAGRKEKLEYKAELMPLSAFRMSEEVISVKLPDPLGNQDLPLELRRSILVTYLDEEIMIVRDESGVPEVLVRELAAVKPADSMVVPKATSPGNSTQTEDQVLLDAAAAEAS
eukprot:TRINITY_DN21540_c0_g1_i1.p1 TRINITY_DN21540_c0_g1~~TRINITY_DN21540_c0_g1_i1.p1  ORF type:complete len:307 (-),score=76.76 TRINITY_DN21540_c0_g1_i1:70-990(-)